MLLLAGVKNLIASCVKGVIPEVVVIRDLRCFTVRCRIKFEGDRSIVKLIYKIV